MKKTTLAIMLLAMAAPVFAQSALPQCEFSNFDSSRGLFTISGTAENAVNQQCLLIVKAKPASSAASQVAANYFVEGTYDIEISAGGGGGGAGATLNQGGGGGGAGAKVTKTATYLASGVYKLTIGAGGMGGDAPTGSLATDGNPSSITRFANGELVAGYPGADTWTSRTTSMTTPGSGGAQRDGARGGDGAGVGSADESKARDGNQQAGRTVLVSAGMAGGETIHTKANAGGGGGAGGGHGGVGQSAGYNSTVAGAGVLGGGGGGGRGGLFTARSGAAGGDGFIRISAKL